MLNIRTKPDTRVTPTSTASPREYANSTESVTISKHKTPTHAAIDIIASLDFQCLMNTLEKRKSKKKMPENEFLYGISQIATIMKCQFEGIASGPVCRSLGSPSTLLVIIRHTERRVPGTYEEIPAPVRNSQFFALRSFS